MTSQPPWRSGLKLHPSRPTAEPGGLPIRSPRRFAVVSLLAAFALAGPTAVAATTPQSPAKAAAAAPSLPVPFTAPEYVIGDPKAPVTVIEYLSDTCSHCAHFDAALWPAIKAKFVDTGKVRWVVREFLTGPVEVSAAGFVLARCAGKDHYFEVIEEIFRAQPEMFKTGDWRPSFLKIAQNAGLDEAQFKACLSDDAPYKALGERVDRAETVEKIDGTPTLIINGKKAFDAVPSVGELEKALVAAGAR